MSTPTGDRGAIVGCRVMALITGIGLCKVGRMAVRFRAAVCVARTVLMTGIAGQVAAGTPFRGRIGRNGG